MSQKDRPHLPRLIGITGKAGAGKDTVAKYLSDMYGYQRYGLADPIKELINERFGFTNEMWNDREWKERADPSLGAKFLHVPEGDFELFSPRSWAQWLGTEVLRELVGPDVWVDLMERKFEELRMVAKCDNTPLRMVVPDIRFDNEAARIYELGGYVIRVERPDVQAVATHVSEAGISGRYIQEIIVNDGSIQDLHFFTDQVLVYLESLNA